MPSRAMNTFNKLKSQGMSDEDAIKKAFGLAAKGRAKVRAADKVKRKRKTRHSPAGLRYLKRTRKKK